MITDTIILSFPYTDTSCNLGAGEFFYIHMNKKKRIKFIHSFYNKLFLVLINVFSFPIRIIIIIRK